MPQLHVELLVALQIDGRDSSDPVFGIERDDMNALLTRKSYALVGRAGVDINDLRRVDRKRVKRGAQTLEPISRSLDAGVGNFIFDFPAFAATSAISIEMIGKARTRGPIRRKSSAVGRGIFMRQRLRKIDPQRKRSIRR